MREINTRYDLKDTKTEIDVSEDLLTITTSSEFALQSVHTVLETKAAKRGLSLKIFSYGKTESASGGRVRQEVTLQRGIDKDLAKTLSKFIRDEFNKVQASIQGDAVRVSAKSKDELQLVIQRLRQEDFSAPLQFTNYR